MFAYIYEKMKHDENLPFFDVVVVVGIAGTGAAVAAAALPFVCSC